jgi:hypothetical protein
MIYELFPKARSDGYHSLKGTAMKLRNVIVVMSAALIGVTSAGFAQAGPRDGHRGDRHYSGDRHGGHHGYHRNHRHGGSNALGFALGLGLLGAAIASHSYSQPYSYAPAYPTYGYAPAYGYQYSQPWNYGYAQPGYSGHLSTPERY